MEFSAGVAHTLLQQTVVRTQAINMNKKTTDKRPWRHPCVIAVLLLALTMRPMSCRGDEDIDAAVRPSLDYLASLQKRQGYWEANQGQYKVAMTALVGTAMLSEGSTTTSGRYAKEIRLAVDYLLSMSRPNGLIGFREDYHYTYGHGFSMLFLSQVYGEEEDEHRRDEIREVLTRAVQYCADAQTSKGGWGYVSAKEGSDFDEGATCITQVQGLRACRNAGLCQLNHSDWKTKLACEANIVLELSK